MLKVCSPSGQIQLLPPRSFCGQHTGYWLEVKPWLPIQNIVTACNIITLSNEHNFDLIGYYLR